MCGPVSGPSGDFYAGLKGITLDPKCLKFSAHFKLFGVEGIIVTPGGQWWGMTERDDRI